MCGRLNVTDDPFVRSLVHELGIKSSLEDFRWGRFKRATDTISIVREHNGQRVVSDATWWLLLEKSEQGGFKASKYTSFNTRYDKLNERRSAGYYAYRHGRCLIPVKGFGESEYINSKPLHYHDIEAAEGQGMLMGGLYRTWYRPDTGAEQLSCSIITLPPHPKLKGVHSKSMPLIFPQQSALVDAWLDGQYDDVDWFDDLLQPRIPQPLTLYPVNSPSEHQAIGPVVNIEPDES